MIGSGKLVQYIDHPLIHPNTIQSRIYQQILYAAAVKEDTLIILPTGLGKTIIIIMAMAHFLKKYPQSKVVLIAPTRPLVDQHYDSCIKFLNILEEKVVVLSGSIQGELREEKWAESKVIITTPQTIRNDIINKRIKLESISLLCFDEAHRAVGDDPYVVTAQLFKRDNPHGRILGFTASPGKNDNVTSVVKNLYFSNIEYMDEDHPQVKPYVHNTLEEWVWVDLPPAIQEINSLLNEIIQSHLSILKELDITDSIQIQKNPKRKILKFRQYLNEHRIDMGDDSYFAGMTAYGQLMLLTQGSEMLETQGVNTFSSFLEKKKNELEKSRKKSLKRMFSDPKMKDIQRKIEELQNQEILHPKVEELLRIIQEQLKSMNDSRILVFSNYKSTISFLVGLIEKIPDAKVQKFVGQTTSSYGTGLTQKQQKSIMDDFKGGEYNILVSSSVGEEGLDVAQCDLVIFYDLTPSATRLIQRKGRTGRAREGKVIYLITKGTKDEGYYYASKHQKSAIKDAVLKIKRELKDMENKGQSQLDSYFVSDESQNTQLDESETKAQLELIPEENQLSEKIASTVEIPSQVLDQFNQVSTSVNENSKPIILIDYREKGANLYRELLNSNIELKQENLPIGDFVISSEIGIERKTSRDFVQSLINRNLFDQLIRLKNSYLKPLLVIEGEDLYATSVNPAAIQGAISAILFDLKIPILYTNNAKETVQTIIAFAKREQREKDKKPAIRKDKAGDSTYEEQLYLLSSLPNIDRTLAERITKSFTSLRDFFNANQDELKKIHGIGDHIADRIDLLLSTPFSEDED